MSRVFHRNLNASLAKAVRGEGVYIFDVDGKRYLDASGGAAVSCLGHGDKEVIEAIKEQAEKLAYVHSGFFTTDPLEALADALIDTAPDNMGQVYFTSGGSEAVENALKLARQYYLERGEPSRRSIISRRHSYHGNTLGALGVGGNALRRQPFGPMFVEGTHIAPCYAYRHLLPGESLESYALRAADELEQAILMQGPENVAAFIAETVVGATMGAVTAEKGYFKKIREICDRYGVLLILDEVMCGIGRTGAMHACELEGIAPDMITVAKGLGGGYQPIGAVLISQSICETFSGGSGAYKGGHTYNGHALACAASLAVITAIHQRDLLQNVNEMGNLLEQKLRALFGDHPFVGDIRGRGLFRGIELVVDKGAKLPFSPSLGLSNIIKKEAMSRGLLCYPGYGGADGAKGDHILLAPPFIINEGQLDELVEKLGETLEAAFQKSHAYIVAA